MEYDSIEKKHAEILKEMAVLCRNNREVFTDDSRLQAIREQAKVTDYQETFYKDKLFSLWSKKPIEDLPEDIILISSHIDVVPGITKCFSNLSEDGFYRGTYDNLGTNAAIVFLMNEYDLPDNIVFAFTGDEETGRCKGARQAATFLKEAGKNLTCIALDVTYEGFHENRLWSIENCTAPEDRRETFISMIADAAICAEPENCQSFCFIKAGKHYIPDNLDPKYLTRTMGMMDEAFAYRDMGYPSLSICLPCNGNMHGNTGVMIKQPVFEGYVLSLAGFLYAFTKSHPALVEVHKIAKENLICAASEIEKPRPAYHSFVHEDEFDEDEQELDWYEPDKLDSLTRELYGKALMYSSNAEDAFVNDTQIPPKYMSAFSSNPDGAILPDEEENIKKYLQNIFRSVHEISNGTEYICAFDEEDDDEYDIDDEEEFYEDISEIFDHVGDICDILLCDAQDYESTEEELFVEHVKNALNADIEQIAHTIFERIHEPENNKEDMELA